MVGEGAALRLEGVSSALAWLRSLPPRQARRRAHRSRHGCGSAPVPLRASVSSVQRTQETRLVARSGAYRRAALSAPAVRRFGGLAGPPSCIPNPRFLLQIFDLEKESRASAGQAARFQRAACLADMRGGFGSLAPARLPYAGRRRLSRRMAQPGGKGRRRRTFSTRALRVFKQTVNTASAA